jgi:hypothetical protein
MPYCDKLPVTPIQFHSPPCERKSGAIVHISIDVFEAEDLEKVINSIWLDDWKGQDGRQFKLVSIDKKATEATLVVSLK